MPSGIYNRTPEHRKRLAEQVAKVRKPLTKYHFKKGRSPWNKGIKGLIPWNKGKTNAQDFSAISGANHYNWKGGITKERVKIWWSKEYRDWRKSVFEKDNYTCQECGARNGNGKDVYLEAHHIKPFAEYPDLRLEITNGITLCKPCHRKTETYGVRKKKVTDKSLNC